MKIITVKPAKRCEICHRTDCFDPLNESCTRCRDVKIPVRKRFRTDHRNGTVHSPRSTRGQALLSRITELRAALRPRMLNAQERDTEQNRILEVVRNAVEQRNRRKRKNLIVFSVFLFSLVALLSAGPFLLEDSFKTVLIGFLAASCLLGGVFGESEKLDLRCPACGKDTDAPPASFCPSCGKQTASTFLQAGKCIYCPARLDLVEGIRQFQIRHCMHCGVLLASDGV